MKKLLLLIALSISTVNAYAQIDLGAAFGGAVITLAIRGVIAFGLFKLITANLTRKTTFTPLENGRWVGAWLLAVSLISFPSTNKSTEDFYFGIILVSLFWLLAGFVIGYVWRKLKPLRGDGMPTSIADFSQANVNASQSVDEKPGKDVTPFVTPKNISIAVVVVLALVYIAFGGNLGGLIKSKSGAPTYKAYKCANSQAETEEACDRQFMATAQFNVDKEKNKVFIVFTLPNNEKKLFPQEDCNVFDNLNWKCGGKVSSDDFGIMTSFSTEMIDGSVTATGLNFYNTRTRKSTKTLGMKYERQ